MDNISIMCHNSVLCRFLTRILSKLQIFVFVIINGSNHVQTYSKNRDKDFKR